MVTEIRTQLHLDYPDGLTFGPRVSCYSCNPRIRWDFTDQPMDVASFGGGFVFEYDSIISALNIASHLGYWATFGQAEWSKERKDSWMNKPIPFPSNARARYTSSLDFAPRLGQDALPRQFYIIPPHKHLNVWARNLEERVAIHKEIVSYKSWTHLRMNPQFRDLGYCPAYAGDANKAEGGVGSTLPFVLSILFIAFQV